MKINPNEICRMHPMEKPVKEAPTPSDSFDEVLKKAVAPPESGNSHQLSGISDIGQINLDTVHPGNRAEIIQKSERLLELLDAYRMRLADHGTSLKTMHPLLEEMESASEELQSSVSSAQPESDLLDIVRRVVIETTMEKFKFDRGDYI